MLAAQGIATGDVDVVGCGRHGVDESRLRICSTRVREGLRMGNGELVDSMIHDGLWCAFEHVPHGQCRRKPSPTSTR